MLFGSDHEPVITSSDLRSIPLKKGSARTQAIKNLQMKLVTEYWQTVDAMDEMTGTQVWIQTGLALTPFCGHVMNSSLDWGVAWSLIGEWTCRELFPPPWFLATELQPGQVLHPI